MEEIWEGWGPILPLFCPSNGSLPRFALVGVLNRAPGDAEFILWFDG